MPHSIPLEGTGLSISLLFHQLENHHHRFLLENKNHHHLVDMANPLVYSLKQLIHLQPNMNGHGHRLINHVLHDATDEVGLLGARICR